MVDRISKRQTDNEPQTGFCRQRVSEITGIPGNLLNIHPVIPVNCGNSKTLFEVYLPANTYYGGLPILNFCPYIDRELKFRSGNIKVPYKGHPLTIIEPVEPLIFCPNAECSEHLEGNVVYDAENKRFTIER